MLGEEGLQVVESPQDEVGHLSVQESEATGEMRVQREADGRGTVAQALNQRQEELKLFNGPAI